MATHAGAAGGTAAPAGVAAGTAFVKLSGSGNDFVALDQLALLDEERPELLPSPLQVRALCHRRLGVGADGVMVLRGSGDADWRLIYYNADGSRAELCGNASLCSVRLAESLGRAGVGEVRFHTDAGLVRGRIHAGLPEIDLAAPPPVEPDRRDLLEHEPERDVRRIGFAQVGVPHVVVLCEDARAVDVAGRGPTLRHHPALHDGANVNFVSREGSRWRIRTFERGVEAETLACGTGSVASALLLAAWQEVDRGQPSPTVGLVMSTGLEHRVTLRRTEGGGWRPSLGGAAGIVFEGVVRDSAWAT